MPHRARRSSVAALRIGRLIRKKGVIQIAQPAVMIRYAYSGTVA